MEALVYQNKKFSINLSKANTKFFMSFRYNVDNSYLFVNWKEIYEFKAGNNNVKFPTQYCLGSIPNKLGTLGSKEESLKANVLDFSVNYNSIDKSDILNNRKYLMIKNSI